MKYVLAVFVAIPASIFAADFDDRRQPQAQIYVQPEEMTQRQYQQQYDAQYGQQQYETVQNPATQQEESSDDAYSPYRGYPTQQIEQPVYPDFQQEIPDELEQQDLDESLANDQAVNNAVLETQTEEAPSLERKKATLQILDKIRAKAIAVAVVIGDVKSYQGLDIDLKRCLSSSENAREENLAYLQITENRNESSNHLFKGWMFSSNPALNSLEHPLYDVVLLSCDADVVEEEKTSE